MRCALGVYAQMLRQQGGAVVNGVASGESLCALFTGSGVGVTNPPLLVPTIDHLTALLEGPRSSPYKSALLELLLIMPCRCQIALLLPCAVSHSPLPSLICPLDKWVQPRRLRGSPSQAQGIIWE